jgi:hypothetical protein
MTKTPLSGLESSFLRFGIWDFGNCDLFAIWDL